MRPARNTALLCTHHLNIWSGSELVLIELAEELLTRGWNIEVYAPFVVEAFCKRALPEAIPVVTDHESLDLARFDLVYCQHQTLSRILPLQSRRVFAPENRPLFVYNHLSSIEPFEFPGPFCEADVADVIWCESPHTARRLRSNYGPRFGDVQVVPNPAPAAFLEDPGRAAPSLRRVLSVSNHLPDDLAEAFALLEEDGIEVTRIGLPQTQRRVRPADLRQADAVVTIGKTVQYAVAGRVPVFCYDRFAGPGWLVDMDGFRSAQDANFSGRNHEVPRNARELRQEILDGFDAAASFAADLPDEVRGEFELGHYVDGLLEVCATHRQSPRFLHAEANPDADWDAILRAWYHEADIYALIDREYGAKTRFQRSRRPLVRKVRSLQEALATANARGSAQ